MRTENFEGNEKGDKNLEKNKKEAMKRDARHRKGKGEAGKKETSKRNRHT